MKKVLRLRVIVPSASGYSERGCQHPLAPNTEQEGGALRALVMTRPAISYGNVRRILSQCWGHLDLEFLLRYEEVTVGKADSSNPSHIIRMSNYKILYTGTKSQK